MKQEDGNITVKWTYTRELPYPYCNKSRRFQVGVKSYNSYAAATSSSGYPNKYFNVSKKRLAEFNFTDLSVNLYHRFFVRSLKGEGNGNTPTASVRSPLQYLKESGELVGAIEFFCISLHTLLHTPRTLGTGQIKPSALWT